MSFVSVELTDADKDDFIAFLKVGVKHFTKMNQSILEDYGSSSASVCTSLELIIMYERLVQKFTKSVGFGKKEMLEALEEVTVPFFTSGYKLLEKCKPNLYVKLTDREGRSWHR